MKRKNFFFLSLLPALAYWYLEANYTIQVAVAGGLILAIIEVILEKIFTNHVHTISRFNFFLILFLGGLSFLGEDGIWFKLQPCFTGIVMGSFFVYKVIRGKGLMQEMIEDYQFNKKTLPPKHVLKKLELHTGILLFIYGIFMGGVAIYAPTGYWIFFKTGGFYIVFLLFMVVEMIFIRRDIKAQMLKRRF